ncbi:MAG TPA: argininosuccinate lyase, partial [Limnochordia bacterium]|nr:argininosuccinate lyase [Limnochordia bacterium]
MKLWSGRFAKATAGQVDDFHSSIGFDRRLYPYDIKGSIAHARMLARCGIIAAADAERIEAGLNSIQADADAGRIEWSVADEDIHMNVERLLIERIGEAGKRLHTARSRNDQVAVDTRLFCKDAVLGLDQAAQALQAALLAVAEREVETVLPGYTHLQRAQPILLAHHLLAYVEMLQRDRVRLAQAYRAADVCPLGSGALAGVTYPIDRAYVAEQLGFSRISANSLDA